MEGGGHGRPSSVDGTAGRSQREGGHRPGTCRTRGVRRMPGTSAERPLREVFDYRHPGLRVQKILPPGVQSDKARRYREWSLRATARSVRARAQVHGDVAGGGGGRSPPSNTSFSSVAERVGVVLVVAVHGPRQPSASRPRRTTTSTPAYETRSRSQGPRQGGAEGPSASSLSWGQGGGMIELASAPG